MTFCTKKRKFLIILMVCLIISELVQIGECDKVFFKVLKAAKQLKKVKKLLPLLLLGPKILVIKTGQSQSSGYQSDPCYPSAPSCCPMADYSSDYSNSNQNSNYNSGSDSGYGGNSAYPPATNNVYPGSSGNSYNGRK